jgi:small nuclear ribonucleoprotein
MAEAPHLILEKLVQQPVVLTLKDARRLKGRLLGIDEHLNLVLDEVEESTDEMTRRLGRVVLRGSNVVSLHAPQTTSARSG